MKRFLEFAEQVELDVLVWCLGAAIVILSLLGGIDLLLHARADHMQECLERGGSYKYEQRDLEDAKTATHTDQGHTESCILPGRP